MRKPSQCLMPHPQPYATDPQVAREYDNDFAECELFVLDTLLLEQWLTPPGRLIDLGCGTGRHVTFFAERGFDVTGVDLSEGMLAETERKLRKIGRQAKLLKMDLSAFSSEVSRELPARICPGSFDYAICMFSTLGLIFGQEGRLQFLRAVRQSLKPGGQFILHVHNYGYNVWGLEGWRFLISNALLTLARQVELGDKYLWYHRRWKMYLHVFRHREILGLLRQAGFGIRDVQALNSRRNGFLRPSPWQCLLANGYIIRASI